jgi:1A family penicillin-binding protein
MGNILKLILASVGRPFYFLISRGIVGLIAIFYIFKKPKKIRKIKKKKKSKKTKVGSVIRLQELRISLFEQKILAQTKELVAILLKSLKNRKTKPTRRLIFIISILLILIISFYLLILRGLPSPKELDSRQPEVSTKIYDKNGNVLYKIYKNENRTIVPLTQIPVHVRLATLAAEDAEFYSHPGFSIKGISRAIVQDIKTGSIQGGSTITQQLVKNTLLTPEKTITRKIKEIILSVEVEANYTKDQILEMYLNEVSYGGTAYGIEEASSSYFAKDIGDLDLAEAALLAGLPKSPTAYSPFGPNPDLATARQKEVLHLMVVNKFITADQAQEAENEKLIFALNKTEIKAPHFVMYVRQLLVDKYGEDMVEKGGLEVTTSLDLSIQETAEAVVLGEVNKLKNLHVGNGAALVINPQTGEVLAMVGSKDYFDQKTDGNVNVTTSLRQPGSSIKVVNYAYALSEAGYTPATIIDDSPITYVSAGTTPYSPVNYDGQFKGHIPLRNALAQSRNIPAVKVLASYGVSKMVDQGTKMGITTWQDPSDYGLALTLGGGAVTALDLSKVYSTLANYGKRPELMPILQVKDYKGRVLEKNDPIVKEVLDPRVAFLLTDILKDNNARAPEFGYNSYLVIKNHPEVAVKTGTSNDLRDNWTVGYNQNYLVLTWVGNNDNSPMSRIASGVTGASPIWNKIMSATLSSQASVDWKAPDDVSKVNICAITGTLPCDGCPTKQEWFLDEHKPTKSCTSEQIQKIVNPTPIPGGNLLDNAASTIDRR